MRLQPDSLSLMILPTNDIIEDFFKDARDMTNHDYDYAEIVKDIFDVMTFLPTMPTRLNNACILIVNLFTQAGAPEDGQILSTAFGTLARRVFEILKYSEVWDTSGVLRIKYHSEIKNDWVVSVDNGHVMRGMEYSILEDTSFPNAQWSSIPKINASTLTLPAPNTLTPHSPSLWIQNHDSSKNT